MLKTIGILAHVDAGKTTFSEQLLYHTKQIREVGRVDHKDAFLDTHFIEKKRGITIFSDQASFSFNNSKYTIIDTPGHVDFSPEMERSIQVMDYAILLISAVDGVQGHTETVWRLLRKYDVPTFIFLNKTDREEADAEKVLDELRTQISSNICDMTHSFSDGKMETELIEWIAERDEDLFDTYLDTGYEADKWLDAMKRGINAGAFFPCASGSALKDIGVLEFLEKLDLLTETVYDPQADFAGRVYKVRHDDKGNRLTYLKALAGTLCVRDIVRSTNDQLEKITQIQVMHGKQLKAVNEVQAGELFAVTGLSNCHAGDGVGMCMDQRSFELIPTLKAKVIHGDSIHVKEVLHSFRLLDLEEPSLQVQWDEHFQDIYVHVMGVIQLEVLEEIVRERFDFAISFGKPKILYKETIRTTVTGYGHFEPLRHYAEVHLKMEPGARNSGISFENICHPNDLTSGFQNVIGQHVLEEDHHGILTGSPLTDVKCTLLTGRGHQEHTSGGDFKEAVYRALRQGLEKAGNILLEPYYDFKIKVNQDQIGRILSDIQQASGSFEAPETLGEHVIIKGRVPVATFMDYPTTFASFTHGKGMLTLVFGGYDLCHNEAEVIEEIGYNKDKDPEYTSSSIFCAKGLGYTVPWDEAESKMHCL